MAGKAKASQGEARSKAKVKTRIEYEMVLEWNAAGKPFKLQKLTFFAGRAFKLAYQEAVAIKNLLRRAGDYQPSEVKLQAVGLVGVLRAHDQEHGIYARKHIKEVTKLVKKAQRLHLGNKVKGKKAEIEASSQDLDAIMRTRG